LDNEKISFFSEKSSASKPELLVAFILFASVENNFFTKLKKEAL